MREAVTESGAEAGAGAGAAEREAAGSSSFRGGDLIGVLFTSVLIWASARYGAELNARGLPIVLPTPPLLAFVFPHHGLGTPLAIGCVVLGLVLQHVAGRLRWGRLLLLGWLLNLAWMVSLTLIDGIRTGWIDVLLDPNEYLHDLPRIDSPWTFLATFSDYIAYSDTVDGDLGWTTHVAAHPPLATLMFWVLQQIGLGGGFWAGALCILGSSLAVVSVPVVLRELGAPAAARRVVPLLALFPGAVWMAVSADGLFAGVAAAGLALVCLGANRGRVVIGFLGGVLLGVMLFLNYGLVLYGVSVITVFVIIGRRRGWAATLRPWIAAAVGVVLIFAAFLAAGFNWFVGLAQLRIRYYQQTASDRPYSYFVWSNFAAFAISCSPLIAVAVVRAVRALARPGPGRSVGLIALSGLVAALLADLSGMSKAETERIWLPFGVIAFAGLALLRGKPAVVALVGACASALLVNHLLDTGW